MKFESFRSLTDKYQVIFFDSYGVLKNYRGVIPGAANIIEEVKDQGKVIRVLTNDASRSPEQLIESLIKIGLPKLNVEEIVTSGMMAKDFIVHKEMIGKTVYLGTKNSANYIFNSKNRGISIADFHEDMIDEIGSVVFLDDEGYNWQQAVNSVINLMRKKTIHAIVANSDLIYPVSKNNVAIATGSIAKLAEQVLNREFIHFGKPDSNMFNYAFQSILQEGSFTKKDILMVGDTLHTDILGGVKFGVDTALVCSGNTSKKNAQVAIKATGIKPDYICDSIGS